MHPVSTTFDSSTFGQGATVGEDTGEDMQDYGGSSFSDISKLDQEILMWHDHLSACLSGPDSDGAHAADMSRREAEERQSQFVREEMLGVPFNGLPVSPAGSNDYGVGGMLRHRSEPISQRNGVEMLLSPLTPPGSDGSGVSPANSCDDVTKQHTSRKPRFQKLNKFFRGRARSCSIDASLSSAVNATHVQETGQTFPRERYRCSQ